MYKILALPQLFPELKPSSAGGRAVPVKSRAVVQAKRQAAGTPWLSYGLAAGGMMLFVWYLLGVNAYASKGYEIKDLQKKISVLEESNKKLNLTISEKSSIGGLQEEFAKANFVSAGQPVYVEMSQFTQK